MKISIVKMSMAATALSALSAATALANPSIDPTTVSIRQDVMSRIVTVEYTLSGGPAIVTAEFLTNGVPIGSASSRNVWGDVNRIVSASSATFHWQPRAAWPNQKAAAGVLSVALKAWALDAPPDYMTIDLTAPRTAERDTLSFYESADALPMSVTSRVYKTEKMLLRKIPAKGVRWLMGSVSTEFAYNSAYEVQHYVTLTNDYYMPVFLITQAQYRWFTGADANSNYSVKNGYADGDVRPVDNKSYNTLRGAATSGYDWPNNGHAVSADSVMGLLRSHTGLSGFDLPTNAEWEYAARAGCPTAFYDGTTLPVNTYSHATLGTLAWTAWNSAVDGDRQSHEVGLLKPNDFGLYDMIGNMAEWVLDWVANVSTAEATAPVGATSGTARFMRGGCWYHDGRTNRIGSHQYADPRNAAYSSSGNLSYFYGFRPVVPASF